MNHLSILQRPFFLQKIFDVSLSETLSLFFSSLFFVDSLSRTYAADAAGTPSNIPIGPPKFPPIVTAANTHIAGKLIFVPTTLG